jgi:hypothetical protein
LIDGFGLLRQRTGRRDLERRLQAVETAQVGANVCEVWIKLRNDMYCGPRGETITRDAFDVVCSRLALVVILPDNGRDAKRS